MTKIVMLSPEDKLKEIRRLYFRTTKHSIQGDLAKALDLLKSMNSEEARERAMVYMEGLAQETLRVVRGVRFLRVLVELDLDDLRAFVVDIEIRVGR